MTSLRVRLVESPKIAQEGQGPGKDHRMLRFPSSVEYVMHGSSEAKKNESSFALCVYIWDLSPPLGEGILLCKSDGGARRTF